MNLILSQMVRPTEPNAAPGSELFTDSESLKMLRERLAVLPGPQRFTDDQIEIIYGIGHSLFMQGKLDNACGVFQILSIYRPLEARAFFAYGLCCKNLGRYADAVPSFVASLCLDPENMSSGINLAECLAALGKKDETITILDPLIKLAALDESFASLKLRAESLRTLLEKHD